MICPKCGSKLFEEGKHQGKCTRFPLCSFRYKPERQTDENAFILFDIETTGLDKRFCRITEIGAIKVVEGIIVDTFSLLCNPGMDEAGNPIFIPANISRLTGITNDMVKDAPEEKEAVKQFADWSRGITCFAGHNVANFDIPFVKEAMKRAGIEWKPEKVIDTLSWAKQLQLKDRGLIANNKQETLAHYFGFKYEAHRAVNDAEACLKIYQKMLEEGKREGILLQAGICR